MSINPPYRFDPLSNLVNVKWEVVTGGEAYWEGRTGIGSDTGWLLGPGHVRVSGPSAGTLGLFSKVDGHFINTIFGAWSGADVHEATFDNLGDGPFYPVQPVALSGTVTVINGAGVDKGVLLGYDYSALTFTADNGHIYTPSGVSGGTYSVLSGENAVIFSFSVTMQVINL